MPAASSWSNRNGCAPYRHHVDAFWRGAGGEQRLGHRHAWGVESDPGASFTFATGDQRFIIVGNLLELDPDVALRYSTAPIKLSVIATDSHGFHVTQALSFAVSALDLVEARSVVAPGYNSGAPAGISGGRAAAPGSLVYSVGAITGTAGNDIVAVNDLLSGGDGEAAGPSTLFSPAPVGIGAHNTASAADSSFALGVGSDNFTLSLAATGGHGGTGSQASAGWAQQFSYGSGGLPGGFGGDGGHGEVDITNITVKGSGSLDVSMTALAQGGAGGKGGDATAAISPQNAFAGGPGGAGGAATATMDHVAIAASTATGTVTVALSDIATAGQGGQGGLGSTDSHGFTAASGASGSGADAHAVLTNSTIATGGGADSVVIALQAIQTGSGSSISFTGNSVNLGNGDDMLSLRAEIDQGSAGHPVALDASDFAFTGNSFDGGQGIDTLDVTGLAVAGGLTIDVGNGLLYMGSDTAHASSIKGFEAFIAGANDHVVDGRGAQVYSGGASIEFFALHGKDVITDHVAGEAIIFHGFGTTFNAGKLAASTTAVADYLAADGNHYAGLLINTHDGGSVLLAGVSTLGSDILFI